MQKEDHSEEIIAIQRELLELSKERTKLGATRSYMNAERTLSVWIRTALATMVFGLAINRFGLLLHNIPIQTIFGSLSSNTKIIGNLLILFCVIMSITSLWRFFRYTKRYREEYPLPFSYRTVLPKMYAFMVIFFGTGLFTLLLFL